MAVKICEVEGCGKPTCRSSKAHCNAHYLRLYRHGRLDLLVVPITDDQRTAMIAAYEAGLSIYKIGPLFDFQPEKVHHWLRKWGVTMRPVGGRKGVHTKRFKPRRTNKRGYVEIYDPLHPNATSKGYVLENRKVLASKLGRPLRPDEHAHHQNEIKDDNAPTNLAPLTVGDHTRLHSPRLGTGDPNSRWAKRKTVGVCANCRIERIIHTRGLCSPCYAADLAERKRTGQLIPRK